MFLFSKRPYNLVSEIESNKKDSSFSIFLSEFDGATDLNRRLKMYSRIHNERFPSDSQPYTFILQKVEQAGIITGSINFRGENLSLAIDDLQELDYLSSKQVTQLKKELDLLSFKTQKTSPTFRT